MNWKLIIMDLDGTLLRSDKTVSDHTVEVLRRCRERGILLGFATARSEQTCKRISDQVGPDLLITCGGARARIGERTLYQAAIPAETANKVFAYCREIPSLQYITAESEIGYMASYERHPDVLGQLDFDDAIRCTFQEYLAHEFYKIVVRFEDREDTGRLFAAFPQLNQHTFAGEPWCSLYHKDADKWKAIQATVKALHIDTAEIVAFGDDSNDVEMLRGCGVGVAMANAIPAAAQAADERCGHNDEDGVARWLEAGVLGNVVKV